MNFNKLLKDTRVQNAANKYIAGVFIYGISLAFIVYFPFYKDYINSQAVLILKYLYFSYLVLGLPICFWSKEKTSKPLEIVAALNKTPDLIYEYSYSFLKKRPAPVGLTEREKIVLRFGLVKFFYIPLMISFTAGNINTLKNSIDNGSWKLLFSNFNDNYVVITQLFFAIDTFIFCFGYIFESKWLKNTLRSVEPTMIGWVAALATYPPFNSVTANFLGWYSYERFTVPVLWVDSVMKLAIVVLVGIYLWATLSLGTKSSNLTNRGIVTYGAYGLVRHPAYISKVGAWWIMMLPNFSLMALVSMMGWTAIYYLRAITEERHLIMDKDYKEYIKKTPYRFIPGII